MRRKFQHQVLFQISARKSKRCWKIRKYSLDVFLVLLIQKDCRSYWCEITLSLYNIDTSMIKLPKKTNKTIWKSLYVQWSSFVKVYIKMYCRREEDNGRVHKLEQERMWRIREINKTKEKKMKEKKSYHCIVTLLLYLRDHNVKSFHSKNNTREISLNIYSKGLSSSS